MSGVPDYALEETLDFKFTTRAFATGIPTTLTSGTVVIYEDNSTTEITAAETLTADFDTITGLNNLRVVATAANGFEAGKSYACVLSVGTVGGVSVVGEVVAQFSIQRSPVNWANVTAPTTAVDLSGTDIQLCDTITTYTGNTVQTGDSFARIGATGSGLTTLASQATADAIETDTQDLQTQVGTAGAGLTAVAWNAAWDAEVESEVNDALVALHLDHLLAVDYNPASKPGTATALLNELVEDDAGVSRYTVNALENAPSGTGASAATIADAVWDEALADHITDGTFGLAVAPLDTGTATAGAAGSITLDTGMVYTADSECQECYIDLVAGVGAGQSRAITGFTFATRVATVVPNWNTTPDATSQYVIRGFRDVKVKSIGNAVITAASIATDAIDANALAADAGTEIGVAVAANADIAAIKTATDQIGTAGAGLTNINLPNQTMDITGDITGNLSGSVGSVTGAVGSVTGAVGSVTGAVGSLGAQAKLDVNAEADTALTDYAPATTTAVLTTQMTEAYNADGAAPTLAQALHLIIAYLTERSVTGTTVTAKKLDGSTTAATFTLNDGTTPTSVTRAT